MTHNQIEYWKHKETSRHNVAEETETNRHNVTTEQETGRHNRATEGIDLGRLAETKRHNLVTEGQTNVNLGYTGQTLEEMIRHNKALEGLQSVDLNIKQGQLDEQTRHNISSEGISRYTAISNSQLNKARSDLLQVQREWEGLKNSSSIELTNAQIQQLDNLAAKLNAEIAKVETETKNAKYEGAFIIYEEFLRGLDSLSRGVDALIPG